MRKILNNLEEYILIVIFPIMTITVFISTIFRYFKLGAIPWSEELARYLMIWIAYIGASLGIKKNAHLGVEILVNKLPKSLKSVAKYFRVAIILLFNALIISFSYKIINHQMNMGQLSPAMAIPIWYAYLAIPVGALLMIIRSIQMVIFQNKQVVN
ncbi:TRAP transporter small permease [Vallitalea guaymasensis]|uniref:TRAP transporter small permease n=1 Tax=Vallitalea guaymasensis TaxID=1185412 RepID=A0A8J8M8P6_9FIRM|nr:TRAP transporter small permease [Vallitalea guaymasensis]QUH28185.1 TRAP transporter small permease [Vallitalea guaymasensis]